MVIYTIRLNSIGLFEVNELSTGSKTVGLYYFLDDAMKDFPSAIDFT